MYDLVVIGGGPAGYHSAEYAAKKGMRVALFEQEKLGGTCLNRGCIPTKSFLHSARRAVLDTGVQYSQEKTVKEKDAVVETLTGGIGVGLNKRKVFVVNARAVIGKKDEGYIVKGGNVEVEAKNLLIATGSVPVIPDIEGIQEGIRSGSVVTSKEMLDMKEVPPKLLVVGGGVVGVEIASCYRDFGSDVTVIEIADKILGSGDKEISHLYAKTMEEHGMHIFTKCTISKVSGNKAVCSYNGEERVFEFDKMLLCVGRTPDSDIEGILALGISMDGKFVKVDDRCRTNVHNVYAAGDVINTVALASVAIREGEVAVNDMLGIKDSVSYESICSTVFTNPEIAFIGLSEEQAKEKGIEYSIKKLPINYSGRSVAENGITNGMCKIIINNKNNTVIGASLMCSYATEIAAVLVLAIQNRIPLPSLLRTVFPHPTVGEIIHDTLQS